MTAWAARARRRLAGASAPLCAALLAAGLARIAVAAPPEVDASVVFAAPVAPAAFRDGWDAGVGIAGGVRWPVGERVRLGIEAEIVQFSASARGDDGLGGARRAGGVALPMALRLGQPAAPAYLELVAAIGYGHESTEPQSGARPLRGTRRDGFRWSGGTAIVYRRWPRTSLVGDLRLGGIAGAGTSTQQISLRLGVRAGPPQR